MGLSIIKISIDSWSDKRSICEGIKCCRRDTGKGAESATLNMLLEYSN